MIRPSYIARIARADSSSAYEISNFHHREPPPKEILEDVSAKGGDLLNRTVENYLGAANKEPENMANGKEEDSEGSEPEVQKTPKEDKMDIDEPGSTGGRITRGACTATLPDHFPQGQKTLCCCWLFLMSAS